MAVFRGKFSGPILDPWTTNSSYSDIPVSSLVHCTLSDEKFLITFNRSGASRHWLTRMPQSLLPSALLKCINTCNKHTFLIAVPYTVKYSRVYTSCTFHSRLISLKGKAYDYYILIFITVFILLFMPCKVYIHVWIADYTACLKKTRPLRLIWHNFTNSQHLLIIFGRNRPYSILCWLR